MGGFSVNTNNNAMAALRTLNFTNRDLSEVQTRINSGLRVNGARDNASMFAIAQGIRGDVAGLKSVSDAIALGQSTVNVAVNGATQISDKLNQIKQKVIDGSAGNVDKAAIQRDITSLRSQIDAIAEAANFNGVNLLKSSPDNLTVTSSLNRTSSTTVVTASVAVNGIGSTSTDLSISGIDVTAAAANGVLFTPDLATGTVYTDEDNFQLTVGGKSYFFVINDTGGAMTSDLSTAAGDEVIVVDRAAAEQLNDTNDNLISAMRTAGFNVDVGDDGTFTVTHANGAVTATDTLTAAVMSTSVATGAANNLNSIESAINTIKTTLSTLGTAANQLESQGDFVKSLTDSLSEGIGILVDADLAEESARLQSLQTKQQLGLQALSIANQGPGAVLSLFR